MSELPIGPRRSARYRIIRSMEKELMGPTEIDERFKEFPSTRYIVGRLSPANEPIDPEQNDGLGVGCDDGEGGYDEKAMPLIMGFHPSSMGISFELDSNEYNLKVEVEWADYKIEEDEEEGGESWRRYQRKGLVENIAINSDGRLPRIPLHPESAPEGITISDLEDKEITLDGLVHKKDDYQTVSLFLVNRRERGDIGDRTKDEKWIAFSMSQGERYWPIFCDVLERSELKSDPKFSTSEARQENKHIVISALDEIFEGKTLAEWETILTKSDLIWERVQATLDLPNDPQVLENKYLVPFDHAVIGESMWHQLPLTFDKTPVDTKKMAPSLGENTEEILIERLDYSWDDISSLQSEGVIL